MEVWVELLGLILVIVDTKLVVISRFVLPLHMGLHSEQLHEGFNFYIVVLAAEFLTSTEEPIASQRRLHRLLRRPLFFITFFLCVIVAIISFTLAFLIFVSIIIITSALRSIVLFLFLLNVGVAFIYKPLLSRACAIKRGILACFNGTQCIELRMRLFDISV